MSDLIYLYIAYTIVWAATFFYLINLHITQKKLKKEIEMLREIINGKKSN